MLALSYICSVIKISTVSASKAKTAFLDLSERCASNLGKWTVGQQKWCNNPALNAFDVLTSCSASCLSILIILDSQSENIHHILNKATLPKNLSALL